MISERYTLFTRIPLFLGPDGAVHAGELWRKDLEAHLVYVGNFRICCPTRPIGEAPKDAEQVRGLSAEQVIPLRKDFGWVSVARNVVPNFASVLGAARGAEVVHSGGAGWAFPLSYYLMILKPFLGFRWLVVIESSFWMKPTHRRPTPGEHVSHALHSFLLRCCLALSDAQIYTQGWYRDVFGGRAETSLIAPAVWVDEDDLIDEAERAEALADRDPGVLRLLFPARLIPDKGVEVVLAAISEAEARLGGDGSCDVELDIMGEGSLAERCRTFAEAHQGSIRVRYLPPVQYGGPFLSTLRRYHAVIVANRQAEQPRVIFDAFSQGVPCIASRTSGIGSIVDQGRTALLFEVGDAEGLAKAIVEAARNPEALREMGGNALAYARDWTHRGMHATREKFLRKALRLAAT